MTSLEHTLEITRGARPPCKLQPLLLGPDTCLPDRLDLGLTHKVVELDLVLPVVHIKSVLKVLGNVLKVLVTAGRSLLAGGSLKNAILAASETATKDNLRAQLCLG
jgi:hypothetical protein